MSSKTLPARLHVAMLNSLRAIEMMGGHDLLLTQIDARYSKTIGKAQHIPCQMDSLYQIDRLDKMFQYNWKAKGNKDAQRVSNILQELAKDGCPDMFIKTMTVILPWTRYEPYTLENREIFIPFIFHPHPFKPSVFNRLKGRMPSFQLYSRMKEIRRILSADLDEETKKRWRDILLVNYPHESLTNQEIRQMWTNKGCCMLLKESKGSFTLMEVDETRGAS